MEIRKSFGFIMNYTMRNMRRYATETLKANSFDLTVDHWGVLEILSEHKQGLSLTDLSGLMLKDLPTLTKIVDLVCKKGLAERKVNANDRRKFDIVLTKKGINMAEEVRPVVEGIRQKISGSLSEEEVAQFITTLEKINEELESD